MILSLLSICIACNSDLAFAECKFCRIVSFIGNSWVLVPYAFSVHWCSFRRVFSSALWWKRFSFTFFWFVCCRLMQLKQRVCAVRRFENWKVMSRRPGNPARRFGDNGGGLFSSKSRSPPVLSIALVVMVIFFFWIDLIRCFYFRCFLFLIDLFLVILQGGLLVIGYFYRGSGLFYIFCFVT